jgi:magnesium-protoporphyrin IX monomethyl ester (oxidative) cyclase
LAYLAAVLKRHHEVFVLDALAEGYGKNEFIGREFIRYGLPFVDIKRKIEYIKPDIVGISCLFSAQFENVVNICSIAKEIDRKIITVVGGAHPSAIPQEMMGYEDIDFIIIGEGECTLINLLECIENQKDIHKEAIDGLGFRTGGQIQINQKKRYLEDLDSIAYPAWEMFPLESYFKINSPHGGRAKNACFMPMITSRGCPFECIFCSVHNLWGRNYRKRSAENTLKEIEYLINRFGVKEILFEDDNLTFDKIRAQEIFTGIANRKLNISWSTPNGIAARNLDSEMLELMKLSGCHSISIGVESGDEDVLKKIIKKPVTLEEVKHIINKAKKIGLHTVSFFVVGFPGETPLQLKNTFRYAENLGADNANFFFATPLPGTRLLELCRERKFIGDAVDYRRLKSDFPSFSTEFFSANKLNFVVSLEKIKMHLLYLLKNPKKFTHRLFRKLLHEPGYFFR